ncbi:DNA (cytosine-5-)-methyltransferase [Streptococcus pneumoniae]|nr:DNA (cytosine-5-)-methyltransferase [Streptococcus pneumoniae]
MTKPYYNKNKMILVHSDTFKFLSKMKPESMDMIFADPPYFLSNGGISNSGDKLFLLIKEIGIKFLHSKKNMSLIVNGFA